MVTMTTRSREWTEPRDFGTDRDDVMLIAAIAMQNPDSFAILFRRYSPAALGLATRIVANASLAEEIVQEVFLSLWQTAARFDPRRGSVRSWLLLQIHHRSVDSVRSEAASMRRAQEHSADTMVNLPGADSVVEEQFLTERRLEVQAALTTLPADQRAVIELAYFGGKTQSQVAEQMNVPLGTVKSRTMAAMRGLQRRLQPA